VKQYPKRIDRILKLEEVQFFGHIDRKTRTYAYDFRIIIDGIIAFWNGDFRGELHIKI
jgi:hypothetical protein